MKLSRLARQQVIPFERLLTIFLLERMLERLVARKSLSSTLIFKGGYVQSRVYGSPRFTVDLDAALKGESLSALEMEPIKAIEEDLNDGVWFRFESKMMLELQNDYGGMRFSFRAGLGSLPTDIKIAQLVNFDLGIGDAVTPQDAKTEGLLGDRGFSWRVYPVEFIAAEKLHAALTRPLENSRSKDIFDLSFVLPKCVPDKLKAALKSTFASRGETLPSEVSKAFAKVSTTRLRLGWDSATKGMRELPEFEQSFHEVVVSLARLLDEK
jgi:predicted nucleotidyltransferase component of viral defense system